MRKLFLGLLLAAFASVALAVTPVTRVGDAAYTISRTDVRVITTVALTASRTWTLPSAAATCIGQNCQPAANALEIFDAANAVALLTPLVIAPVSGDTINGSTSSLVVSAVGSRVILTPVGPNAWTAQFDGPKQNTVQGTAPTVFHSGGVAPTAVATGTDSTAVNTETYIVEVFIPIQTTLTGVKWLGLASSTGNVQFSLANSTGKVIAAAQTASTATTATADYQTAAFAATYVAAPGKYFILMQNSGSNHYRTHVLGNFGASKKTGETYGTFTDVTAPTTFTTGLGCICDVY